MPTTTEGPRVRPGAGKPGRIDHWTAVLPEALQLLQGRSPIVVLPPQFAGEPITACTCEGLLVYVRGAWRHTDACLACRTGPCGERHTACTRPEPAPCQHGCGNVVALSDRCVWDGAEASCCNCCSNLLADPVLDGRDLR